MHNGVPAPFVRSTKTWQDMRDKQEAQLSQKDHATLRITKYSAIVSI